MEAQQGQAQLLSPDTPFCRASLCFTVHLSLKLLNSSWLLSPLFQEELKHIVNYRSIPCSSWIWASDAEMGLKEREGWSTEQEREGKETAAHKEDPQKCLRT